MRFCAGAAQQGGSLGCFLASVLHLLLVMFSVNGSYKEVTHRSFMRGEQYIVSTSRETFSLAWCEEPALFSKLFKQGAAVPVYDQLRCTGGKPIISFHSFSQCQPSSQTHLFHTF